jgi:hypothetical protein
MDSLRAALMGSAAALGSTALCSSGAGLVDAVAAVALLESGEPGKPAPICEPPEEQAWTVLNETLIRTRRRSARAVFRFGSNQRGVTFLCKVDRTRFHRCPARFARRYPLGRHVLRVKARSADGQIDRTPAVFRFRVRRAARARW